MTREFCIDPTAYGSGSTDFGTASRACAEKTARVCYGRQILAAMEKSVWPNTWSGPWSVGSWTGDMALDTRVYYGTPILNHTALQNACLRAAGNSSLPVCTGNNSTVSNYFCCKD